MDTPEDKEFDQLAYNYHFALRALLSSPLVELRQSPMLGPPAT